MASTMTPASAAQGYKSNAVAGLSQRQMFFKGLHGLTVHLKRAALAGDEAGDDRLIRRASHLADADRLLTFLIGISDERSSLGGTLQNCYTGIQQLIATALNDSPPEADQAVSDALAQAQAFETEILGVVGGTSHGRSH